MNWKIVYASETGSAHLKNNTECQDNCVASVIPCKGGEKALLCVVADGAGSAERGKEGAELACHYISQIICEWAQNRFNIEETEHGTIKGWIFEVKQKIEQKAFEENLSLRDYACTLIGALLCRDFAIYFQVGDGAIVIKEDGDYKTVFWPDMGEYVNITFFITDDEFEEHIHTEINKYNSPVEIALFSDGIQRLALHFASRTVHSPFFEPMFKLLRKEAEGISGDLCSSLGQFLSSSQVNERTDDDKTLILATRKASEDGNDSI